VFRTAAAHLVPGVVFAFDAFTDGGMRLLSGAYVHADLGADRFAIWFDYDAARRREESWALLKGGVEVHRRVPIDPPDVAAAAAGAGLRVDDYFSDALVPGRWGSGSANVYVLTRRVGGPAGEAAEPTGATAPAAG
jgi:hypothetical protein